MNAWRVKLSLLLTGMVFLLFWSVACTNGGNNSEKTGGDAGVEKKAGSCEFNSDCKSCDQKCSSNQCVDISCTSNSDCRCNWKCVKNKCYDPDNAPCQVDDDCTADPKLWKCKEGQCIDGGCRSDGDCASTTKTPVCDVKTNTCVKKSCTNNLSCTDPSKPVCDKKTGDCVADPGKKEGESCDKDACLLSLTCHEADGKKTCRRICDPFKNNCPSGNVCIPDAGNSGVCLAPGPGLKLGEDCSGGKACQKPYVCGFAGGKELCRQLCKDDSNCDTTIETCQDYQKNKLCLPKSEPCGPGRSCAGEDDGWEQCINGKCTLSLCPDNLTCDATDKCSKNGRCVPRECPTDKCDEFYECKNNRCVKTNEGKLCGAGKPIAEDKCGDGLVCAHVGYIKACVRPCSDGKCSQAGFTCQKNYAGKSVCIQPCPSGKSCKYKGFFCLQSKRTPTGNYCLPAGQPTGGDLLEACDSSSKPCLPDLSCFTYTSSKGYCIRNCTSNSDCGGVANAICANYSGRRACYYKCPRSGSCSVNSNRGYCGYAGSSTYICRVY